MILPHYYILNYVAYDVKFIHIFFKPFLTPLNFECYERKHSNCAF